MRSPIAAMRSAIAPVEGRVRMMLSRAIIRVVDDAARLQAMQIELLDGEAQDGVERFQQYGLTAHPHPGAEAVACFPAGLRSHGIVIAVDDRRFRLTGLQQGEVALHDDLGNIVKLGRDELSVIAHDAVLIEAPEVTVRADTVTIDSSDINLGGDGGQRIARIGDNVDPATNKIVSGSDRVMAL